MSEVYLSNDDISILSLLSLIGLNCVHFLAIFYNKISLPPYWGGGGGLNIILRRDVSSLFKIKKMSNHF